MINWTKNLAKPATTCDKGTIILGKYTLPNKPAFAVKVPDVEVRQLEK